MFFPRDIFYLFFVHIKYTKTYIRLSLTCKLLYSLSKNKDLTKKFLQIVNSHEGNIVLKYTINLLLNGEKEGIYESWYKDGRLCQKFNYIQGKREGMYEEWYDNGQLNIRQNYISDEIDGLYEKWYPNGKLYIRTKLVNGKMNGLYELWYENGDLKERCNYIDGVITGFQEAWNYNGELIMSRDWGKK